jgi:hypothetical protein
MHDLWGMDNHPGGDHWVQWFSGDLQNEIVCPSS